MDLSRRGSRLWALVPAGAALAAGGLGFLLLGRKSLSTDEAFMVSVARQTLGDVIDDALDSHLGQVVHLLVVHPIARVNDAEWAVRSPSVVAAALAAALGYLLAERLFGRVAGAVAAFALALNAGLVAAAQLAQPYALAVLGVVLSTLLFVVVLERASSGLAIAYAVSAVVLPLLHPAAASVVAAHLAAAIVRDRRASATVLATGGAALLATPLVVLVALDRADAPEGAGVTSLTELGEGIGRGAGWNPVLVVLAVLGAAASAVRLRSAATWKAVLVGGLAVAPLLALLLTSLALPVFPARVLILAAPGLALGAGAAVASLADRPALGAAAALAAASAVAITLQYAVGPEEDWRAAARALRLVKKPSETVVVAPARARPALAYYAPEIATSSRAGGDAAWVLVHADTPVEAIELGRTVVKTPRYALRRQFRYGDGIRLQHWVRP